MEELLLILNLFNDIIVDGICYIFMVDMLLLFNLMDMNDFIFIFLVDSMVSFGVIMIGIILEQVVNVCVGLDMFY